MRMQTYDKSILHSGDTVIKQHVRLLPQYLIDVYNCARFSSVVAEPPLVIRATDISNVVTTATHSLMNYHST